MSSKVLSEMPKTLDVKHLGISLEKGSIWDESRPLGKVMLVLSLLSVFFILFWVVPTIAPAWDHWMDQHHFVKS